MRIMIEKLTDEIYIQYTTNKTKCQGDTCQLSQVFQPWDKHSFQCLAYSDEHLKHGLLLRVTLAPHPCEILTTEPGQEEHLQQQVAFRVHNLASSQRDGGQPKVLDRLHTNGQGHIAGMR